MIYIQRKCLTTKQLETVDEFPSYKEAFAMINEYRMADPAGSYYLSTRPCKDWSQK